MKDKVCTRCKDEWPSDGEFYRTPTSLLCRACESERRDEIKADPELAALPTIERKQLLARRWYLANRQARLKSMKAWRTRNLDKTRADALAYYYAVRKYAASR